MYATRLKAVSLQMASLSERGHFAGLFQVLRQ